MVGEMLELFVSWERSSCTPEGFSTTFAIEVFILDGTASDVSALTGQACYYMY